MALQCHGISLRSARVCLLLWLFGLSLASPELSRAQTLSGAPPPPAPEATELTPDFSMKLPRAGVPAAGDYHVQADKQDIVGSVYHLRGHAILEFPEMVLKADEMDYDEESGHAEARGNVYYQHFSRNEKITCDRLEYNTEDDTGKFYNVRGYLKTRIDARPGVLTSNNPFYFESRWAERIKERYVLHDGMITDCRMPSPWWTLQGPRFDVVPGERALAYKAIYRLRKVPLFYTPFFYKSLEKEPRRSGFLTPNIGHSSRRGFMVGAGYYWAINRSYDVTYRLQDFTSRGLAHHVDFRGKPTANSDFNAIVYGVQDKGQELGNGQRLKQGGFSTYATGHALLPHGFEARGTVDYLSSLLFRQAFTESFNEAVFSESHSSGVISKHWGVYTFNTIFSRLQNFQDAQPHNFIVIRKLPEFDFSSRDRRVLDALPVWFSFDSSVAFLHRGQPQFSTVQLVERSDAEPRVMTAFRFAGMQLLPSFTLHETNWTQSFRNGQLTSNALLRNAREIGVDLILPSIERIFDRKTFLGDRLKHVIEPRATFRYVAGVTDFDRLIRFDETELLNDTQELDLSLTQRLYAKRGNSVNEVLTWQVMQRRYFDPTFGGALLAGERNVLLSSVDLTPYAFLTGPRNYSPVISFLRLSPINGVGVEWRADYDPLRAAIVNSGFTVDVHVRKWFLSGGHNQVHSDPKLSPPANQLRGVLGLGDQNRRGWNAAVTGIYDYRKGVLQFATTQVTYNTDCCGFSVQYRRFNFGARDDNQYRVAFTISNVGSFGTLKKQERLF